MAEKFKIGQCSKCPEGEEAPLVYRATSLTHALCAKHNFERKKNKKRRNRILRNPNLVAPAPKTKKQVDIEKQDREMYARIWNTRPHFCENCGEHLGQFLSHGFMSHILPKSIYKHLRHDPENINLLCYGFGKNCHDTWGNGRKLSMKIFYRNYPYMIKNGYVPTDEEEKAWKAYNPRLGDRYKDSKEA